MASVEAHLRAEWRGRLEHRHVVGHRKIRIMLFDEDKSFRRGMKRDLEGMGYSVALARGVGHSKNLAGAPNVDIVFLGRKETYIDLAERIQRDHPGKPIFLITGLSGIPRMEKKIRQRELMVRVVTEPRNEAGRRKLQEGLEAARIEIQKRDIISVLPDGDRRAKQLGLNTVRKLCRDFDPRVFEEVERELNPPGERFEYLRDMCERLGQAAGVLKAEPELEERLQTFGEVRLALLDSLLDYVAGMSKEHQVLAAGLLTALRKVSALDVEERQARAFQHALGTLASDSISPEDAARAHARLEGAGINLDMDFGPYREDLRKIYLED